MRHGGGWAYSVGCRCAECVEAWNARHRGMRARRAQTVAERSDLEHGTRSTYSNYGCRCDMRQGAVRIESGTVEPGSAVSPIPRHEWPGRIVLMFGCTMSLSCVALLILKFG